ncbi:MAG: DUF2723 domain-containing protein [Magnetococcales bacterium]|nr:DUF2723 domain-containing protein [Magnetococcales bacterium]
MGGVFGVALGVYLITAPRGVALEDDGFFILAAWFNGVAHPPGYPLHSLLGHLFAQLPWGSPAWRIHALSGFFGAVSCALLWRVAYKLLADRLAATVAALGFAFSPAFWSQAILAEVYTLNTAFFFLLLGMLLESAEERDGGRFVWKMRGAALVFGLSLANHWPLMLLSLPALLAPLAPRWRETLRTLPSALPWLALGLSPYLWMYFRSRQPDVGFVFHGPMENLEMLWAVISRQAYAASDVSPAAGWSDRWWLLQRTLHEFIHQFIMMGFPFVLLGMFVQFKRWDWRFRILAWTAFLAPTVGLIGLLGFEGDEFHRRVFRVYPLLAWGVAALWLGLGFAEARRWLDRHETLPPSLRRSLPAGLAALLILSPLLLHGRINDRSRYDWAERYARSVLESVEPGAILFTDGDALAGPVGYLHHVEGVRPDVTLYSAWGLLYPNRLFHPHDTPLEEQAEALRRFIRRTARPVYYVTPFAHPWGVEERGFVTRIRPDLPPEASRIVLEERVLDHFRQLVALEPWQTDAWTLMQSRQLLARMTGWIDQVAMESADPARRDFLNALAEQGAAGSLEGRLVRAEIRLVRGDPALAPEIAAHLQAAEGMADQAFTLAERARLARAWGNLARLRGDEEEAQRRFQQSLARWNHPDNPARRLVTELDTGGAR